MAKIVITGASGYIGSACINRLLADESHHIVAIYRSRASSNYDLYSSSRMFEYKFLDFGKRIDDCSFLHDVKAVIHCAAKAHFSSAIKSEIDLKKVNVDSTLELAKRALAFDVKRFVYISSIGVNGSKTTGFPFTEHDFPFPLADYALSKREAEEKLRELVAGTDMELVIIRPPLVYGAGAPGNFDRLLSLVHSGLPLPLASIENRRSFIALDNLVDFIITCIEHPKAANELFVVSDGEDISTPKMIRLLAQGMGKKARLWPCPSGFLRLAAKAIGRDGMYQQLCGSLQVDSNKARSLLNWTPRVSVEEGLRRAGQKYKERASRQDAAPTCDSRESERG